MSAYQVVVALLCAIGLTGSATFVVLYSLRSREYRNPWWKTEAGRWLLIGRAEKAALFALVIANMVWDNWPGRAPVTIVLFGLFVVMTWWPVRILRLTNRQRAERDEVAS